VRQASNQVVGGSNPSGRTKINGLGAKFLGAVLLTHLNSTTSFPAGKAIRQEWREYRMDRSRVRPSEKKRGSVDDTARGVTNGRWRQMANEVSLHLEVAYLKRPNCQRLAGHERMQFLNHGLGSSGRDRVLWHR
jgi:hypothetical protein